MPRQCRCLSSSKVYHIMVRGNEKKSIFRDDEDRLKFIDIIRDKKKNNECLIYAFCLMDNHAHLVIKEETDSISRIMKRINTSYAYYFNNKYDRVGHVFQDRFKSEEIETEKHLLAAIRYIHNNPVKAKIAKEPSEFPWSSYNSYISRDNYDSIISKDEILSFFSKDVDTAKNLFIQHSMKKAEEIFIDYNEDDATINKYNASSFLEGFLREKGCQHIGLLNNNLKKELVLQLKKKSNLSTRQIAAILGVNRNFVQRAK
ncbi:MAG: REP-associated tyrosine transposase [Bacillota bacterium]